MRCSQANQVVLINNHVKVKSSPTHIDTHNAVHINCPFISVKERCLCQARKLTREQRPLHFICLSVNIPIPNADHKRMKPPPDKTSRKRKKIVYKSVMFVYSGRKTRNINKSRRIMKEIQL